MKQMMRNTLTMVLFMPLIFLLFGNTASAEHMHTSQKAPIKLKVMTFNMHHGVGLDGELNLQRVAKQIRKSGADIIGLNEVDNHYSARSHFKNQAKKLAENAEYELRIRSQHQ